MQSCSVHHCVLLLLTLTFTTAPVAAAVCRVQAKLHQRVTLPCEHECPGEAKWTVQRNRDVVFARCDQTSCSSVVKGYEMSHDQYLKGDLSLTITAAEFSMRDTYACECRSIDYAVWRLRIDTVFSAVQKNPGEDLILDLTVPEPVEVIYTSSDSADGERICTVTQHSLQCKAEYTHRASLRYPELTLRDVTHSDSGLYTIRDTENKEDIRVYAVAVTAPVADAVLPVQAKLHQRVTLPAPVAVADCRVQAKLHQRVTLPCEHECSGEAMWTLQSTRSVFARCDETSCSSVVKGYEMSHDQYLKGDLSLTITAAEYSMRNTYVCECRSIDYAVWRLRIDTVISAVQKNPGEDLILDLSVPEPVEVIYTSSDSADGERICNVTQRSLQCKAEYTHRASLRYPELTLRDVTHSDSGLYTIRDTENNEDIRVYAVAVTAVISAVQKNPGEDLILDLTVPEPVEVIYTSSDSADGERICTVTQHSLQCKAEYTHRASLRYPELTLRDVTHSDSGLYTIRDTENNEDIRVYAVAVTGCKCISSPVAGGDGEVL
ncbi:uncharacterized protein LOC124628704 isoform X2 [Ictalurus punctatus]|uniref:Uncharacterized protein LOC124628704 isoform X2 n=1 Tax=Ictalurus punctatus TaxID=7998 RepID=A0A9F7RBG0_ICTPU|nr:uncharacterized protein LOC124628704 isoform X2 [Ictalurus punctatus]